ncbi:MAG TPA: LacI family DNA-binding transcriptional regulator, partial [Armatimonadota bacterium]
MARVTIKDLAKASGLSVCTVNKALYNKPWVSDVTRRRVLELAEQLGYHPNRLAQSLARRTLSLAVLYPQFWGHWFDPLVEGVRQGVNALQDHNIAVQFRQLPGSPSCHHLLDVLADLAREGVDGVILCSGYTFDISADIRQSLSDRTLPMVLLGGSNSAIPYVTCVRADARRCGRMAGELLGLLTGGAPAALIIGQRDIVDHQEKVEG